MKINEVIGGDSHITQAKNMAQVSSDPVASDDKHQLVQNILLRRMLRRSNIVRPTQTDLEVAKNVVGTELKAAEVQHEREVEQQLRLRDRQARRRRSRNA